MGLRKIVDLTQLVIIIKLTNYFSGRRNVIRAAIALFWLIIVSCYIYTANIFLDAQFSGKIRNVSIKACLDILAVLFILVKDYIPAYRPNKNVISNVFPLNYGTKNTINVLYEFLSPSYLITLFFFAGVFFFNYYFMTIDLIISILMVLYSFSFNRLFKNILESNSIDNKNKLSTLAVISFLLLIVIIITLNSSLLSKYIIALISFIIVLSLLLIIIGNRTYIYREPIPEGNIGDNLYLNLLFINKKLRLPLIVGILLKTFVLTLFTIGLLEKNRIMFNNFILWLFISPAIIFTYFLNNFIGYQRELFLALELSSKRVTRLLSIYINSFLIIFSVDILISFVTLNINGLFNIKNTIYYLTASVCFLLTGIIFSLADPRLVLNKNPFIISSKSIPFIANLVTLSELVVLLLIRNNIWCEIILLLFILMCMGIFIRHIEFIYKKTKYKLYLRLFSSIN